MAYVIVQATNDVLSYFSKGTIDYLDLKPHPSKLDLDRFLEKSQTKSIDLQIDEKSFSLTNGKHRAVLLDTFTDLVKVLTEMTKDEAREALAKQNKSGRLITPEAVAAAVVQLAALDTSGEELMMP